MVGGNTMACEVDYMFFLCLEFFCGEGVGFVYVLASVASVFGG